MDNFDQSFDNHFHNHFDNHFDQSCYEPADYSIDPLAFVPGAALDASKPSWGASLAIQQGIEALEASRAQAHAHPHDGEHAGGHQADGHTYDEDGGQDYYGAPAQTRELPPADVYPTYMTPTALSAPAHFYPKKDAYADRTDLTEDGKQMLRDADALLLMLSGCYGDDEKDGQKVSHKKNEEGLQASNLAVTPLPPKSRFHKEYLWNPKGVFQFTRDFLAGSLRFRY